MSKLRAIQQQPNLGGVIALHKEVLAKKPPALQIQMVPDEGIVLYAGEEGGFSSRVWRHAPTGIHGITCCGHLDDFILQDEGDRPRAFARSLRFVENIHPSRFVWNLGPLQGMGFQGLELLKQFHRRLAERTTCAMVRAGGPNSPIAFAAEDCPMVASLPKAIAWLSKYAGG